MSEKRKTNPLKVLAGIAAITALAMTQPACLIGTYYVEDHTVEGAAIGAAAGAATGAAVADYNHTSRWQGAAYGAAGGAVIGGAIGSQIPPDPPPQTGAGISVVPVERVRANAPARDGR